MSAIHNSLAKIESMLTTLVGGTTTKRMRPPEFVSYAHGQIAKAMTESGSISTRRLKALQRSVSVFKDNWSDDEAVDVPIYENDVTAMDDKSTQLTTPGAAADLNPDGQTAFEQGFVAKLQALRSTIDAMFKAEAGEEEDEEKRKAAGAEDGEDEEKRKADGEEEEEEEAPDSEDQEKAKKKPADDDAEKAKATTKRAVTKGADVSPDGTAWPADLNDPSFVKDGKVDKRLDWGTDPA